jgi:hypothetical protein
MDDRLVLLDTQAQISGALLDRAMPTMVWVREGSDLVGPYVERKERSRHGFVPVAVAKRKRAKAA